MSNIYPESGCQLLSNNLFMLIKERLGSTNLFNNLCSKKYRQPLICHLLGVCFLLIITIPLSAQIVSVQTTCVNKTIANGLGSNKVNDVFVVGSNIYAVTNKGLSISTDGGTTFKNKNKLNNGLGSDVTLDVHVVGGTIYVSTDGGGLSISTNGGAIFTNKTIGNGLGSDIFFSVHESGGTLYIATFGSGLGISTNGGASFSTRTTANGLGSNFIKDICI